MPLTPISTPTKKRTIRDISNTYNDRNTSNVDLPLTPTKTPIKKQRLSSLQHNDDDRSCRRKLIFTPDSSPVKPKPTPFGETSIYSQAKALFQRGSKNEQLTRDLHLPSREKEASFINKFLDKSFHSNQSNSLYISGPPGTGKTAQVNLSLQKYENNEEIKIVRINCMTLKSPEFIFHEIYASLVNQLSISFTKRKNFDDLYEIVDSSDNKFKTIVLFLDELDSLLTQTQQVLFKLFQMANSLSKGSTGTKVILIGISNTLDLNNKFLPKLFTNNMIPESVQFLPYSATQIKAIITSKLAKFNKPIFHPVALQFCCQKAASISGDLRKAFDICYKSIELVEIEQRGKLTDETNAKQVMISHVAKVCAESFTSNTTLTSLSVLHKSILCQLFNLQLMKANITVNMFYDYYQKQQQLDQMQLNLLGSVKSSEFLEILTMLESNNCIVMESLGIFKNNSNGNDNSKKVVKLNVDYDELVKSIEGIGFLRKLLKRSGQNL